MKQEAVNTELSGLSARPLIVGATGGTASGKTSLCLRVEKELGEKVTIISLDSFYKGLS
jgi:uridine kinase